MHDQPTRQDNVLDLVFTDNPSLIKNSQSIPGISDHAMVVTDSDVKPVYDKQKSRKVYLFSKQIGRRLRKHVQIFRTELLPWYKTMKKLKNSGIFSKPEFKEQWINIPSSNIFKKKNTVPWFNRNLKRMTRRKARLSRHAKKSKQWSEFKQYQKLCKKGGSRLCE